MKLMFLLLTTLLLTGCIVVPGPVGVVGEYGAVSVQPNYGYNNYGYNPYPQQIMPPVYVDNNVYVRPRRPVYIDNTNVYVQPRHRRPVYIDNTNVYRPRPHHRPYYNGGGGYRPPYNGGGGGYNRPPHKPPYNGGPRPYPRPIPHNRNRAEY